MTIELRGAHWLWVTDLSQPEQLAIHILPIVMVITQFIQQKMTPNPSVDPSQAKMMQFMPLMFGFFFYNMSSGLVLYWLTSNLVGILQQWLVNQNMPMPPPVEAPKIARRRNLGVEKRGRKEVHRRSDGAQHRRISWIWCSTILTWMSNTKSWKASICIPIWKIRTCW